MTILKRELDRHVTGPILNDEDWWRLTFDTETKRLYVEDEWAHTDVHRSGPPDSGSKELEITDFLNEGGQHQAHRELFRLISGLFEGGVRNT